MGTLILPASGPIYLDTSGFIYSVERIEPYRTLLESMWQAAQAGRFKIISSELVLLETLVKPFRQSDTLLENLFRSLFNAHEVRLIPATAAIWEHAARLRASTGLKTPDAVHAATALATRCTLLVTNDAVFRRVPGFVVAVLQEII